MNNIKVAAIIRKNAMVQVSKQERDWTKLVSYKISKIKMRFETPN